MNEITMQAAGYKKEKPKGDAKPVEIVDENQPDYCYPTGSFNLKECPVIEPLVQDGFYEMRALVRVKGKYSGDKKSYDGGGNVELEYHKVGFARSSKKGKAPGEMNDKELDEEIEENPKAALSAKEKGKY